LSGRRPAIAGSLASAVALGAGELVSGLTRRGPSLLLSVGQWVIERVPPTVESLAIGVLGTSDKPGLVVAMTVVAVLLGGLVGRSAQRRFWPAALAFPLAAGAGTLAALSRSTAAPALTVIAGITAAAAGLLTLRLLLRPAPARDVLTAEADEGRRGALRLLGQAAGLAVVAAGTGRLLARLLTEASSAPGVVLARATRVLAPPPAAASFEAIPGLTPLFTPNRDFYRIDTALVVPRVDLDRWRLRVTGMVDRPFEVSYAELMSMPQVEADITLSCVSNEVGGKLAGAARWQGVPLAEVLERAGVRQGATQIVGRSVDGWTSGFPTEMVSDGRAALVAVGMNGKPLPLAHGFPARLVVSGIYGYVSATKWLTEIELTTLDFDAYWAPRGWSKLGPVKSQSRIDVPRDNQTVPAGRRSIAGVAWAPIDGVARVEVSIDDGSWQEAILAEALSVDIWRQWRHDWDATPGRHRIAVRTIDGRGEVQTAQQRSPRPGAASGHHSVDVSVR
jgi:DMSO/TMAO reductase YedYZ molybdopterin-dependent catalytic subunit